MKVFYGHHNHKYRVYINQNKKKIDRYIFPDSRTSKKILEFNALIPIYCLVLVLTSRNLILVFESFSQLLSFYREWIITYKMRERNKGRVLRIPSLGAIYWERTKLSLQWRLGSLGIWQNIPQKKRLSLCQTILLSKLHLKTSGSVTQSNKTDI